MVKWKEDGKPKQVDIAKKSKKNVDIKIRKPFFPDPVTFNAVEKDNGRPISLRGRKELDVYPRMERVVEKIELRECLILIFSRMAFSMRIYYYSRRKICIVLFSYIFLRLISYLDLGRAAL